MTATFLELLLIQICEYLFSVVLIIVYLNISRLVIFYVGVRAEGVTEYLNVYFKLNVRVLLFKLIT